MHPATHVGISELRSFEIAAGLTAEELDVLGRVASFSAGTMVGELAFIDGERRSGKVVTEADAECFVFEAADFVRLQESHPRIHAKVLRNISVSGG